MLFNSLSFAAFFAVVFIIYWLMPAKYRYICLALSSWGFYLGFGVKSFVYMVIVTIISYAAAIIMQKNKDHKVRLCGLIVVLMVGGLAFFKYTNFLVNSVATLVARTPLAFTPAVMRIAAPVGISFFTFKIISYLVEVKRGNVDVEYNFLKYSAYVGFFPQVASGPIGRPGPFFARLNAPKEFDFEQAKNGIRLIAIGLFKKMIIADKLSAYVNKVFLAPSDYQGFALMIAAVLFSIQIYCDFSGYSDMANGVAGMLGYDETVNFRQPYLSASVKEFWGRWHISLSTWFRDYIYIPLGGSRVGNLKYARNIMIVFLVSGLWHGAAWTFVLWGVMHGLMQVIETFAARLYAKARKVDYKSLKAHGIARWIKVLLVFIFVTLSWVFFEADSIGNAFYIIRHMLDGIASPMAYVKSGFGVLGINGKMFIHLVVTIGMLLIYDLISYKTDVLALVDRLPKVVRYLLYVIFIDLMIIWFLQYGADSGAFVYFQF